MPDLDNDNPTPDFDALIEQARQLREEGKDDEAIAKYEEARKIDGALPELCELMELYIKTGRPSEAIDLAISISAKVSIRYKQFSDIAEAVNTYNRIFETLGKIPDDEIVDSPGTAYAMLAIWASDLGENDPYHLAQRSMSRADDYGWSDFHTKCYMEYCAHFSEENLEETLTTFREWAQENPAAWFYVGSFEYKKDRFDEAVEAYGQVPENDPNYVRAMLLAGECWECYSIFYEAEECYQKALDAAPKSREVRLDYLCNRLTISLEEAAENGFERDRVSRAYEFITKIYSVLSGQPTATEPEAGRGDRDSAGPRLLAEQDTIFWDQLLQGSERRIIEQISDRIRREEQQTREEIHTERKSIQEGFSDLRERWEDGIVALQETIRERVTEQLQLTDEKLDDCERNLSVEHSEFWGNLTSASRRYLATGCYILDVLGRNAVKMEYSCAAIEFTKTLEAELRQHLVDPFISFAAQRGRGPNIFEKERGKITVGDICYVLETSGLKSEFSESLEEKGRFLLTDFPVLKKINKLRSEAAHVGDIGRRQASDLRDLVLKILPKIVALSSR